VFVQSQNRGMVTLGTCRSHRENLDVQGRFSNTDSYSHLFPVSSHERK